MYYRVSIAQINPEQKDAFVARADELRDAMQALPGLQSVTFIQTGEGEAVGLAVYDSEESFMKAAPLVVENNGRLCRVLYCPSRAKFWTDYLVNVNLKINAECIFQSSQGFTMAP